MPIFTVRLRNSRCEQRRWIGSTSVPAVDTLDQDSDVVARDQKVLKDLRSGRGLFSMAINATL